MKIRLAVESLRSFRPDEKAKHSYYNVFLKCKNDLEKLLDSPFAEISILVIGCGYHYTDVILFNNYCNEVIGLDVEKAFYRDGYLATVKSEMSSGKGLIKAIYWAFRKTYKLKSYYNCLHSISGITPGHRSIDVYSYSGTNIPFKDKRFDVVISNAVLEHVEELDGYFKEINRVTKEPGLSYHLWHNFHSFSGGHVSPSLCYENPWGHLRGAYESSGVNKASFQDIMKSFNIFFEPLSHYSVDAQHNKKGIDAEFQWEEADLLTPSIKAQLNTPLCQDSCHL